MTKLIKGFTLMHEHITIDLSGVKNDPDCRVTCFTETKLELQKLYQLGVRNIVDVTNRGMGQDPEYVNRMAKETGINILQSTGFYKEPFLPKDTEPLSIIQMADEMIQAVVSGIKNTPFRAEVIGEIGTSHKEWKPAELKLFEATVLAHKATNTPIYTHTTLGTLGLEQAQFFLNHQVNPQKVVIGHLDLSQDLEIIKQIARLGFYVGFDTVGKNDYFPDSKRIEFLCELEKDGLIDRVVLSEDLTRVSHLEHKGGIGYTYLFTQFLPALRKAGIKESSIEKMLIDNPKSLFEGE